MAGYRMYPEIRFILDIFEREREISNKIFYNLNSKEIDEKIIEYTEIYHIQYTKKFYFHNCLYVILRDRKFKPYGSC